MEHDPNGKNPHQPGAKLDAGKAPVIRGVLDYFPRAIEAVAMVSAAGAEKYAWKGWETVDDGYNRYMDALGRHIIKKSKEGPWDSDFIKMGKMILHDAQVAWNALAALELFLREQEEVGKQQAITRTVERTIRAIPERLPESGKEDPFADCRQFVRSDGVIGGMRGSAGAVSQSEAQAGSSGCLSDQKGTR